MYQKKYQKTLDMISSTHMSQSIHDFTCINIFKDGMVGHVVVVQGDMDILVDGHWQKLSNAIERQPTSWLPKSHASNSRFL